MMCAFGKRVAQTKGSAFIKAISASALPPQQSRVGNKIKFSINP